MPMTSERAATAAPSDRTVTPSGWRLHLLRAVGILGSYLVLSVVLLWPLVTRGFATHLPVGADALLDSWGFSWLPFAILHGHNPFFTTYVGYPGGVNLLANTTQLGLALVEWPVTALFGPIASFNLACLLAPPLTGGSAYLLALRFTRHRLVAWVAGLFFAFSSYEMVAMSSFHFQLLFIPLVPLFFLVLHELLVRQTVPALHLGLGLGALIIGQFFISTEVLVMTCLMLCGATLLSLPFVWRQVREAARYVVTTLATGGLLAGFVLIYPLVVTLRGPGRIAGLEILTPQAYRADLLGPITPTGDQVIAPAHLAAIAAKFATASSENYSYLGLPLVLVLILGTVALWRRRLVLVTGLCAVAAFVLSLGGGLAVAGLPGFIDGSTAQGTWLPGRLLEHLPLLDNVIPSRFALFSALGASLVLAAVVDRLLTTTWSPRWSGLASTLVVVLCALPLLPSLPFDEAVRSVHYDAPPGFATVIHAHVPKDAAILTFPYPTGADMSAVWNQQQLGFVYKMPAGYFRVPQGSGHQVAFDSVYGYGFGDLPGEVLFDLQIGKAQPITPTLQVAFLAQLRAWHIHQLVAIVQGTTGDQQIRYLSTLLGPPTAHRQTTYLFEVAG